jgi:competence protein ComEC
MAPLPALALGTALGGLAWPFVQPPAGDALLAALATLLLAVLAARRGPACGPLALLAVGALVGLALPSTDPPPLHLDGRVRVRGTVVTAAQGREADVHASAWARPSEGVAGWQIVSGRVRVRFPETPPPPGAKVALLGDVERFDLAALPGALDPSLALAAARVAVRVRATEAVRLGPPPYAPRLDGAKHGGLLRAMLDGDRSGIPGDDADLLRRTGTWHVVSISGLHVGLCALAAWGIAAMLTRPLALVWRGGGLRWLCAAAAVAAAWAYADLAGMPLPARRSVWMVAAGSVLAGSGRRPGRWELLSLAWLGCALAEPDAAHDVGAQLSFGALAGIFACERWVMRWVPPDVPRWVRWTASGLAATVGSTVGTLPVVALHFQSVPLLAPLANLFATPLLGTVATPALLLSQVLPSAAGDLALCVADAAVEVGLRVLVVFDAAAVHPAVGVGGAVCLTVAPYLGRARLAGLALASLPLLLRPVPKALLVTFLAVGQGDAALIEWPDGRVWLVDGGPPGDSVLKLLRRHGVRRLDALVLSHPHPDHLGGLLPVARGLPVGRVYAPRAPRPGEDDFVALLSATRAPRSYGLPGIATGSSLGVELLHPARDFFRGDDAVNDESLVLRVGFAGRTVLLPGDVEAAGEAALVARGARADVLKLAHHGSKTSSSPAFLRAVSPSVAVASCGSPNRYGHPHPATLRALRTTLPDARLYRTDRDGNVTVRLDAEGVHVTTSEAPAGWRL